MADLEGILYKHSIPTRYDVHPRLTLWNARITNDNGLEANKWFAQMGSIDAIDWKPLGTVLEEKIASGVEKDPLLILSIFKLMFAFEGDLR